jgi:Shikimate kinase
MDSELNLFLVGPMGVGKTTIGKLISKRLGRSFVDLDDEIESRAGACIPWIFDVEGEEGFRRRESELLREFALRKGLVISTGGGIVLKPENRVLLKSSGCVIFLNASAEQLHRRTMNDKKRPLLQVEDRLAAIHNIKTARDPFYREVANIVIDVGNRSSRQVTDTLLKLIATYEHRKSASY